MSARVVLRPAEDFAAWDRFVAAHPDGTPFHLAGFLRAVAPFCGLEPRLAQAVVDGEVVGVVPLMVRRRGPFAVANHGLGFSYLGPLLPPEVAVADVLPAVRRFLGGRSRLLRFTVKSVRPFDVPAGPGWSRPPGYDRAVVPVSGRDDDALVALLDKGQAGVLRRALRRGLTEGEAKRDEVAAHMTAWANAPFRRQGLPPRWADGAHLAVFDALAASGVAHATAIRRDGELVAMTIDLAVPGHYVGWEMGLSDRGRADGAAVQLILSGLRRARELGAESYDLLGAPTEGIAAFKRSLGAHMEPTGIAQWDSAVVPVGAAAAGLARRLRAGVRR